MLTMVDAKNNTTSWAYDLESRPITKTYADGKIWSYGYESTTSRLKTVTDALNQVKTITYAKDNLPTGIVHTATINPTPDIAIAYDAVYARPTTYTATTTVSGTVTAKNQIQYAYGAVGSLGGLQIASIADQDLLASTLTWSKQMGYDQDGRMSYRQISFPSHTPSAETFTYDALGRLATHANELGTFTMGYLGQTGQMTSRSLGGSTMATTWGYGTNLQDRRLAGIVNTAFDGNTDTWALTTDVLGRVVNSTRTNTFGYITPGVFPDNTTTFNNVNQITGVNGGPATYDANGNMTFDGDNNYSWDAENRLVKAVRNSDGSVETFTYNGLGQMRTNANTGGGGDTLNMVWCGTTRCSMTEAAHGYQIDTFAEGERYSYGENRYFGFDNVGSVVDSFANPDPAGTGNSAVAYPLYGGIGQPTNVGFGAYPESLGGRLFTLNRFYDYANGRWINRDPAGENVNLGANLYGYVDQDPINVNDPSGLCGSSKAPGHYYSMENRVCTAAPGRPCHMERTGAEACVLPGHISGNAVESGDLYAVYSSYASIFPTGIVRSTVTGPHSYRNTTTWAHPLSGTIDRIFSMNSHGDIDVKTIGQGTAATPIQDYVNQSRGPSIFEQQNDVCSAILGGITH